MENTLVALYNEYGFAIYLGVVSDEPIYREGNSIFDKSDVFELDEPGCETLENIKSRCLVVIKRLLNGATYRISYQPFLSL